MDLSYLNARIRAWNGEFLSKEKYDELIKATDIKSFTTCLKETIYARDIEMAVARYKNEIDILEGTLRGNLANAFQRLWNYTPLSAKAILQAVFSIWEVYNLKAIVRAKDKGVPPDESISILIPAGEMDETALKELNQQKDIKGVLDLLSTWGSVYARPIRNAIEQYKREKRLIFIELALDRFLHNYSLSVRGGDDLSRGVIKRLVRERIDNINIATLLKLCGEEFQPVNIDSYFLEGGYKIDRVDFLKLAKSKDRKELLQGLIDSAKDSHWKKVVNVADSDESFFLEEQLEELIRKEMCRLSIIEPLSIALPVCFIYKKVREIKNLRLIIRAKVFHIPEIEVRRFIII
ncbi:MAG: V-type ATPase subunit [Deltaproteobacteria bacterium]|nr:V-type ATPase subunit [Deltaproteobacteria bacterium]